MKTSEAIQMIDQALGTIQANRETHAALLRAMEVIKDAVTPKNEKEVEK